MKERDRKAVVKRPEIWEHPVVLLFSQVWREKSMRIFAGRHGIPLVVEVEVEFVGEDGDETGRLARTPPMVPARMPLMIMRVRRVRSQKIFFRRPRIRSEGGGGGVGRGGLSSSIFGELSVVVEWTSVGLALGAGDASFAISGPAPGSICLPSPCEMKIGCQKNRLRLVQIRKQLS